MATLGPPTPSVGQTVLRFLEGLGQRSEAEMYLRLFRSLPRGRFALVAPSNAVLRDSGGTLVEQIAFLRQLGLDLSLVVGATEQVGQEELGWLIESLLDQELSPHILDATAPGCLAESQRSYDEGRVPVFVFHEQCEPAFSQLVAQICPRKIIFLRNEGGLGPHEPGRLEISPGHFILSQESGLAVINLRRDELPLSTGGYLSTEDVQWLARSRDILEKLHAVGSPLSTVSIASPLYLLRELFTVKGEGTLVKLGAHLSAFASYGEVEQARLEKLIEESFQRSLRPGFFEERPLRLYVEREYRGLALLKPGVRDSAFLSKFAVLPVARGEGLAQDLLSAFLRDFPRVYWRSRIDNPINAWYMNICDGMHREPHWHVYWRGMTREEIPACIEDALQRPIDFL